jgi:hypothetical protein
MSQGTTSVVPKGRNINAGFSPCGKFLASSPSGWAFFGKPFNRARKSLKNERGSRH